MGKQLGDARDYLDEFVHYYNQQRPHHVLDRNTPVEEVQNYTVPKLASCS